MSPAHLPPLDPFWASFFVSPAHLPPLDPAWTLLMLLIDDVPLVEFTYLVFTRMPGELP